MDTIALDKEIKDFLINAIKIGVFNETEFYRLTDVSRYWTEEEILAEIERLKSTEDYY